MTNYVDLRRQEIFALLEHSRRVLSWGVQECAELPEIELEDGKPRMSGRTPSLHLPVPCMPVGLDHPDHLYKLLRAQGRGCRADADCPRSAAR